MSYGQKTLNDLLGNSSVRISAGGCFLVAFANLLERFSEAVDPLTLNQLFLQRGAYFPNPTDIDPITKQGRLGWLGYTSITKYDNSIVITDKGVGRPKSNNSIVKFTWGGPQGNAYTHFCLVADAAKGLIVDSWDGLVKSWDQYGGPDEYATYADMTPHAVAQPVVPIPTSRGYNGNEITVLAGDGLSVLAEAAGFPDAGSTSRWVAIAALNGSGDWNAFNNSLRAGQRIIVGSPNAAAAPVAVTPPADAGEIIYAVRGDGLELIGKRAGFADFNTHARYADIAKLNGSDDWRAFNAALTVGQAVRVRAAAPVATPAPAPAPTPPAPETLAVPEDNKVEVRIKPSTSYKETAVEDNTVYIATESCVVKDLDGLQMDLQLLKGQSVHAAQAFMKDGVSYVRTAKYVANGMWYGVPLSALIATKDKELDDHFSGKLSSEANEFVHNMTSRERLVNIVGKTTLAFSKLFAKITFKKGK